MSGANTAACLPGMPPAWTFLRRHAQAWAFTFFDSVPVLACMPITGAILTGGVILADCN